MKRSTIFALMLIVLAVTLTACGTQDANPQNTDEPTALTLYMGFRPDIQFAPWYVGLEQGFFEDAGLDITLQHASESDMVRLLGTNEAQFAVVSGEQVLLARAQDIPVVYVFEWYQQFPVAIAAKTSAGITQPADLAGRSIGSPMLEGASYIGLEALLGYAGLADADIALEATGFTQVETLMTDRVEAVVIYATNEPVQLAAQGVEADIMRVSDYVDLVSNGLITNETTLDENPELISAVVGAFAEAVAYTIEHPDEAYEMAKVYVEGLSDPELEETQKAVLANSIALWETEQLGYSDQTSWEAMQTLLLDIGLLDTPVSLDEAFTNEFLP